LLALLLVHRNEVLSVEQISGALRVANAPADLEQVVADSIARLRETLGSETLLAHPWGYGLRAPPGSVDADEFERLVERARAEEPARAVETLRDGLALWRGPAFADFADESFAQDEIARLEDGRRAAEAEMLELPARGRRDTARRRASPHKITWRPRLPSLRSLRWKRAAAGAVVVAAVTGVIVWGLTRSESRHVVAGPNMVAALDPKANRIVDAFTVGSVPRNVAVGGDSVWAYNANDHTVSLIDPRTRLVRTVSAGGGGDFSSLGVGPNSAWVGNGWAGTVSRIDARSAEVVRTIRLPGERYTAAGFIATSPSEIWISGLTLSRNAPSPLKPVPEPPPPAGSFSAHFLAWRIDPHSNRIMRTITLDRLANTFRTFVIRGDSILVRGDYGLVQLDRRTGRVEQRLALPSHGCCESAGLAIDGGSIWVVGLARGVLWRIDARTDSVTATIHLRGQPAGVAVGAGAVWVADAAGGILKIDPDTNEVVERIPIAGVPQSLAFGLGRVWVALD
jgi:streptogramin lyase